MCNKNFLDVINTIEQLLINFQWERALELWVKSFEPVLIIRWFSEFIKTDSGNDTLLRDIISWCDNPNEELRWAIFSKSQDAGFTTECGGLALALFLSGGSMSPADYEPVYAQSGSITSILHSILMYHTVNSFSDHTEGAKVMLRHWVAHTKVSQHA